MSVAFTAYRNNKNNYPYSICVISFDKSVVKAFESKNINLEPIATSDDESIFYSIFDDENGESRYDICFLYSENYSAHIITMLSEIRLITKIPIIVMSYVYDEAFAVNVLRIGADEYIINSVGRRDMNVRIEKIIEKRKYFKFNNLNINSNHRKNFEKIEENILLLDKFYKYFTPNEIKIITKLLENIGEIVYRQDLSILIRGYYHKQPDRSIDTLVSRIRKKLKLVNMTDYQIKSSSSLGYIMLGDKLGFFDKLSENIKLYGQDIDI